MGKVNNRDGGKEEEETQRLTLLNSSAGEVAEEGALWANTDGNKWFPTVHVLPAARPLLSPQQLTLEKGKLTFVSNYSGMSIVAEKIGLAFKFNYKQMYHANVKRDWSWNVESPRSQVTEWASESGKHSHLPSGAMQIPAPKQQSASWRRESIIPRPNPNLISPLVQNSTKHSSVHYVHFLPFSWTSSHFCLQVVLLYASTYVLVSLSIDRYHAIVYPMKFLQGGELPWPSATP